MFESVISYFISEPRRLRSWGEISLITGSAILLAGLVGKVATTGVGAIGSIAHLKAANTLAEIYPSLPTWWIPESIAGALPAVLLISLGVWLKIAGKQLSRFMES